MLTALGVRRGARGEAGFTLVELCVAMAAGIVVLFGLTSIMIVTLHQTQRTFTRVDATRRARTALATIENELHSACVGLSTPVQSGSTADSLTFLSFYGTSANPTPVWHELTFDPAAATLTDTTYDVAGTGPTWTKGPNQTSQTTLLTNVAPQIIPQTPPTPPTTIPVFQYYAYKQLTGSDGSSYWIVPDGTTAVPTSPGLKPDNPLDTSSGLSVADATDTVEVVINLLVGASSEDLNNPTVNADPVTDAISLRLTTPPNQAVVTAAAQGYGPCQ